MPQGLEVEKDKYTITFTWQATEGVSYNIYSSETFPVDVADPSNLCSSYRRESSYIVDIPSLVCPRHYAITAIDRYGNESAPLQWENVNTLLKIKAWK